MTISRGKLYRPLMIMLILIVAWIGVQPPPKAHALGWVIPTGIEIAGFVYAVAAGLLTGGELMSKPDPNGFGDTIFDMSAVNNRIFVGALIKDQFRQAMQMAMDGGSMVASFSNTFLATIKNDRASINQITNSLNAPASVIATDYTSKVDRTTTACNGCNSRFDAKSGLAFMSKTTMLSYQFLAVYYDYNNDSAEVRGYNPAFGYNVIGTVAPLMDFSINRVFTQLTQLEMIEANWNIPSTGVTDAFASTGSGASGITLPPLTTFTPVSTATNERLNYNWNTGVYTKPSGAATTEPVTWIPPKPVVKVDPATNVKQIGVTVPIAGQDVFVPTKEVTNTHNPYQNFDPEVVPLRDFSIGTIPIGGVDVYYPDLPYHQLDIQYTPANTTQKGLDVLINPPIATWDPVTGRITATADGTAIIRVSSPAIPQTIEFPMRITGVPVAPTNPNNPPAGDWPTKLKVAVTTRFPFSLPWDIAYLVNMFITDPQVPVIDVNAGPIKFKVTLNQLDPYMPFFRAFLIAGFLWALALNTRKLLGGGQ